MKRNNRSITTDSMRFCHISLVISLQYQYLLIQMLTLHAKRIAALACRPLEATALAS